MSGHSQQWYSQNDDEAYDALLGGDFGSMNIMSIIDQNSKDKGSEKHDGNDEGEIEHLPDAIDFWMKMNWYRTLRMIA